ncbi:MAG: shikimate kinase [Rickettsiales bacterium]|nr:shikimate kinase [Rickettsiales bacterium]
MIISLVGFMGSGKTTTSKLLKEHYKMPLVSTDKEIEKFTEKTISEIFSEFGEEYFRDLEHKIIEKNLTKDCVLDVGGGAFIQERNKELFNKIETIFLNVPFDVLKNRLEKEKNIRPLLLQNKDWKELLNKRLPFYSLAKHTVNVKENDDVNMVFDKVKKYVEYK